jgi:hypothetical protein
MDAGAAGTARRTAAQRVSQAGRDDGARPRRLRVPCVQAKTLVRPPQPSGAKMTSPQIAEAQRMAREWNPR